MRLAALALLVAGCGGYQNGYAVDLTIDDSSLLLAQPVSVVIVDVSGAETGSYRLDDAFPKGAHQERIIYRPNVKSGTLTFDATAYDTSLLVVATGKQSMVPLEDGQTITATINLLPAH